MISKQPKQSQHAPKRERKTHQIAVKLEASLFDRAVKFAARQHREITMAQIIRYALREYLDANAG